MKTGGASHRGEAASVGRLFAADVAFWPEADKLNAALDVCFQEAN
jgi:hypothetical protein